VATVAALLLGASALAQQDAAPVPVPVTPSSSDAAPSPPRPADDAPAVPLATPPAAPETPRPVSAEPDLHQHEGLFIHADVGAGYLRTRGSRGGSPFTGKGAALGGAIAVGWSPDDAWALAVEIWGWKALSASGLGSNTSVELQALGLNVTRYLLPIDVFASVVLSGTRLAITDYGDEVEHASSDIGFGLKVLLGKEWRVDPSIGIGLAGELFLSVNRSGGVTLDTLGGGLVFSFTYR
jgi:hypothetical protein